jgi:hypothetical protein
MILKTIIFVSFYFLIFFSTLGFGFFFSKLIEVNYNKINLGVIGILGICFLTFISYFSNFFFAHHYLHNILLHTVGLVCCVYFFIKSEQKKFFFVLFILSIIFLSGLFISKNHEDFPYYHFAFTLNLVESNAVIGIGNFNSGYRTPSSLFYFHSLLYLPYIKYYLFHSSGILILTFANFFLLEKFLFNKSDKSNNFINILSVLIFVFINIVFSRLGAYGTDRAGQIVVFILVIHFYDMLNTKRNKYDLIKIVSIFIFYIITVKSYFIVYLFLFLIIFYCLKKDNIFILINKNLKFILLLSFFFISYLISNILNSGCLVYPAISTCFDSFLWSANKEIIKAADIWYELWAKAGATPNYVIQDRENYIKYLNWLPNWINNYFFTKGSDTISVILSILTLFLIFFILLKKNINKNIRIVNYKIIFFFIIVFSFVWFFKHPDLRYGGYVLISLLFLVPASVYFSKFNIDDNKRRFFYKYIVLFVLIIFNFKNIIRINSELHRVDRYQYNNFPFFYVEKVNFKTQIIGNNILIHIPENNNCWSVPFPCVEEYQNIDVKEFGLFKIFFKHYL